MKDNDMIYFKPSTFDTQDLTLRGNGSAPGQIYLVGDEDGGPGSQ